MTSSFTTTTTTTAPSSSSSSPRPHHPRLCQSAQMVAATLQHSPEAAYLLNANGIVLYENPAGKRLLFETTDQHYDLQAGHPSHSYHFSFFWTFSSPTKPWQDYFDDLIYCNSPTRSPVRMSPTSRHRRPMEEEHEISTSADTMQLQQEEEYDIVCKRTNGTEFPAVLRLHKVGACPCCNSNSDTTSTTAENDHNGDDTTATTNKGVAYLVAYVKARGGEGMATISRIQQQTQNPFKKEDHHLKVMLNASLDPVVIIDEHGVILLVNKPAIQTFGWAEDELVGNDVSVICGGNHGPKHHEYIRNYLDTGIQKIIGKKRQVPVKRKDGSEFPVELGVQEISCEDYGITGRVIFCAFFRKLSPETKEQEQRSQPKTVLGFGMAKHSLSPAATLVGRSRAGEATHFFIPELKWVFDCGDASPGKQPRVIFLTHLHPDHVSHLTHYCFPRDIPKTKLQIYLPERALPLVEQYLNSYEAMTTMNYEDYDESKQCKHYQLVPVKPGQEINLRHGGKDFLVNVVECVHRIDCVGYSIFETRHKLKSEYEGLPGPEIGKLRKQGVDVTTSSTHPFLCHLGDTTHAVFDKHPELLKQHSTIVVECSFLDESSLGKAEKTKHMHWFDLKPFVEENPGVLFLLIHFSLTYSGQQIRENFQGYDNVRPMLPEQDLQNE